MDTKLETQIKELRELLDVLPNSEKVDRKYKNILKKADELRILIHKDLPAGRLIRAELTSLIETERDFDIFRLDSMTKNIPYFQGTLEQKIELSLNWLYKEYPGWAIYAVKGRIKALKERKEVIDE